jgi:hypothetical protein
MDFRGAFSVAAQYASSFNVSNLESSAEWYANEYNVSETAASLSQVYSQYNATDVAEKVRARVEEQLEEYNASGSVQEIQAQTALHLAKAHQLAAAAAGMDMGGQAKETAQKYLAEHPQLEAQAKEAAEAASQAGIPLRLQAAAPAVTGGSASSPAAVGVTGAAALLILAVVAVFARRHRRSPAGRAPAQELV